MQQVFINHDTDLLDVTLSLNAATVKAEFAPTRSKQQDAEVASHGSHAPPSTHETIHTTQKHPWLTTDNGWVKAGDLHVGEQVQRLDGSTATITALKVVAGEQEMYDLTVSQVHTFAVGDGQAVVHNTNQGCGVTPGEVASYGSLKYKSLPDKLDLHHVPADKVIELFGIARSKGAAMALPKALHANTRTYQNDAKPIIAVAKAALQRGTAWNKVFRQELARDLWDLHGHVPNTQLRQVIRYWRSYAPFLLRKR